MNNYNSDFSNSINPDNKDGISLNKENSAPGYYNQPQQAAQPGYPQNPYGAANPYSQAPVSPYGASQGYLPYPTQTAYNKAAILSIIFSGVAFLLGGVTVILAFASIPGVIFGHKSLRQIAQSGEQGKGVAIAGLILGYITLGITALFVVFFVILLFIGILGGVSSSY